MNRVGMVIDMSHSAEVHFRGYRNISSAYCHNSCKSVFFHPALRNKSNTVLHAIGESEGMLGFSVYPFHLKGGSIAPWKHFAK